ncbi:c-type cytochrome [Hoeflea sp. TYP-13]|uniref:c-type cytochrome n=1 Tax=Hoeflea sp. TYP-13 TaxID=3230023 RepID=UPI0034C6DB7C
MSNHLLSIQRSAIMALSFLGGLIALNSPGLAFDEKAARKTFKKCVACHAIGEDARNKVGPHLNGIVGRSAASLDDYRYSSAMKVAGQEKLVWSIENLSEYLTKPRAFIKGTRMGFAGLKDAGQRENLIQWMASFDMDGKATRGETSYFIELLGQSAAALEGDREYGEYISGECVTCHRLSGQDDGIPSIVGWPKENFIHALYEYKTKVRENPVMQSVTAQLGDEEMAALAAYFGTAGDN